MWSTGNPYTAIKGTEAVSSQQRYLKLVELVVVVLHAIVATSFAICMLFVVVVKDASIAASLFTMYTTNLSGRHPRFKPSYGWKYWK